MWIATQLLELKHVGLIITFLLQLSKQIEEENEAREEMERYGFLFSHGM